MTHIVQKMKDSTMDVHTSMRNAFQGVSARMDVEMDEYPEGHPFHDAYVAIKDNTDTIVSRLDEELWNIGNTEIPEE